MFVEVPCDLVLQSLYLPLNPGIWGLSPTTVPANLFHLKTNKQTSVPASCQLSVIGP
jgi:hypothetical protein